MPLEEGWTYTLTFESKLLSDSVELSTTTIKNEHSCLFLRSVVVFQYHHVSPLSWGGFDPSPHLSWICITSPPATSIENEQLRVHFWCWWAPHLIICQHRKRAIMHSFSILVGSAFHHPPLLKMSNDLLIFNASGLHTSLPPHHHPPPPKMSTCVLVFGVGLLSTSLPPHYHPPPPLKTSTCVLIFSGCLPYYCLPPSQMNTRVLIFSGALLLTSPPPAPTIENECSYSFLRVFNYLNV